MEVASQLAASRREGAELRALAEGQLRPFLGVHLVILMLITFVPAVSTWLPRAMGFKATPAGLNGWRLV